MGYTLNMKQKKQKLIKGYKGFDKYFQCRGFQYEVGKEYKHEGEVSICNSGFHFCEHPLDVLGYYNPAESRFAEVEGNNGEREKDGDTKVATDYIKIGAEISLKGLIEAAIKFTFDKAKWYKKSIVTKKGEAAKITGDSGAASATGDSGAASATGNEGCAVALGWEGKALGALGCWLTIAEWKQNKEGNWYRTDVQTKIVDGKKIKADIWYQLKNGKFVAV
jgi:hypothetical protein